jgi:DNA-binding NarL/FixJ family response regulator
MRLVLIEDHQALREGLELLLDREGCDVVGTAGTADEGRRLVEDLAPDVALVDIRLGEDDGIVLTRRLLDPRLRPALLSRRSTERLPSLSNREREVLDLLAQGLTGEQVAERLVLSAETIKTHIRNAMTKLEAHTRVHAIAIALREGFISPPDDAGIGSCA